MNYPSKLLEEAVEAFAGLPGIGKKTALRLSLYLLQKDIEFSEKLSSAVAKLKREIRECEQCFNLSDEPLCSVCKDASRDQSLVCVVETIRDVMAIEETNQFRGVYHVLGGVISPIDGIGPSELNIDPLIKRINSGIIKELIMAISPTIEGETTTFYISKQIKDPSIRVSTIARGVAFGGELQYTDEITLGRSIVARIPYRTKEE